MQNKKSQKTLLSKAKEYQIPHSKINTHWSDLETKVCEFESIIEEADEWFIEWHYFGYDPEAIKEAIQKKNEEQYEALIEARIAGYGWDYTRAGLEASCYE